jgi:hypothetical protein
MLLADIDGFDLVTVCINILRNYACNLQTIQYTKYSNAHTN